MIIGVSGLTEDKLGNRGSAGAGKSEVAKRLVAKHGFVEVALADEIKRIAMRLWDFTEEQLWGPSEERNKPDKRYPIKQPTRDECGDTLEFQIYQDLADGDLLYLTPRHALQQIGTEVARLIDPDVWVRFTMKVAKQLLTGEYLYMRTVGLVMNQEWEGYSEEVKKAYKKQPAPDGVVIPDVRFPNEVEGIRREDGKVWRKKRTLSEVKPSTHASEVSLLGWEDDKFDALFPGGDLHHLGMLIDSVMDVYTGRIRPFDEAQKDVPPFKRN